MACLTDQEINIINEFWGKVDKKTIGGESLARLLITYPMMKGKFTALGDLSSNDAIIHNPKVIDQGEKIMDSVGEALKNINNLDAKLSQYDSEMLNLDDAHFQRFGGKMVVLFATILVKEFSPQVHDSFKKAFTAVSDALSKDTTG